jgi:hypothetical protein
MNQRIVLNSRPSGLPVAANFRFETIETPVISEGQLLLKPIYVSVDPYLRGRMNDSKSYVPPFQLNQPISSGIVAEIIESKNSSFKAGEYVLGALAWQEYQISDGAGLTKVDPFVAPLSVYLGALGMTGLTAYFGLTEIGMPKPGEILVVSGAAGAVGTMVGQIGKLLGCRVVGIAGSEEKIALLKSKFGYDEAINYKTTSDMKAAIAKVCPDGVDIYFDNVGGEISDAVLANINKNARIPLCGAISTYNATEEPLGPRIQSTLIKNSALIQGFIVSNYAAKFPQGLVQLGKWFKEGKIQYSETIVEGFNNIPQAFIDLFSGKNEGKMIVKI